MALNVIHISTECYPAAKTGGLGDVVGSLPIYLNKIKANSSVIIPKYDRKWFKDHKFKSVFKSTFQLADQWIDYEVLKLKKGLPFDFYCVDIPGLFDRESIYLADNGEGFQDEPERNISFQRAVCYWLESSPDLFDIIHCHDHQSGLIPFFLKYGDGMESLRDKRTFFTIHNGQYRGAFSWEIKEFLGAYDESHRGLLDWDDSIHSLASAVKCADQVNTVSPSYMLELQNINDSLHWLYNQESDKSIGILNGIDSVDWDPETDDKIPYNLKKSWDRFKQKNKKELGDTYKLNKNLPLIGFIGRLSYQKGVDSLVDAVSLLLAQGFQANFFLLGSGDHSLEYGFQQLNELYPENIGVFIGYSEPIARQVYAASDYIVVPSRFEPCGLNQLFAMRYGAIPIVNETGGLIDTVPDISKKGNGIVFKLNEENSIENAFQRAVDLYSKKEKFKKIRERIGNLDFSWEKSAKEYLYYYNKLMN